MQWWQQMSLVGKWVTGVSAGIVALGGSFATLGGGIDQLDQMVTTEIEHTSDINKVLEENRRDRMSFKAYAIEKDILALQDQISRNQREIDRLDRDLAGGKYNNADEKDAMLRSLKRNETANTSLEQKVDRLQEDLKNVKRQIEGEF